VRNDNGKERIKRYAKRVEEDEEEPFWYKTEELEKEE